ncbi:MAG TPA: glycosyltransferase family 2 protein, partial [Nitrospinaceae bacterium]|nr:glycosyltransferase family 2 protein [Nitrospinaceae bacterium]
MATEISKLSSYADTLVQLKPMEHDKLYLYEKITANKKIIVSSFEELPTSSNTKKSVVLLNGNLNHSYDIHDLMLNIKSRVNRFSRLVIVLYNPYFAWTHSLLKKIGLKKDPLPTTYLTRTDLKNILDLSEYEIVQTKCIGVFPWNLFGLGKIINLILEKLPFIKWFSQVYLITARPIIADQTRRSLSIVVPARNEYGNIRDIMERLIDLKLENKTEVIFVEGNSTDDTWEEILKIAEEFKDSYSIQTFQQQGKGKGDAVRLGFEKSKGELFTILDADLSMPPELLPQFINTFHYGHADFINGTRLVYPMEGQAMRPLNWLGNIFFAKLLSWILEVPLGDSL